MNCPNPQLLESYIKVYPNSVSSELRFSILQKLDEVSWRDNLFYNVKSGKTSQPETGKWQNSEFYTNGLGELDTILMRDIWSAISKYIKNLNIPYFCSWEGFTAPRYNRYTKNQIMAKHCDHIHEVFDGTRKGIPILSVLVALDDDYEGGEFVMFDDHIVPMEAGSIVVFPSNFLYPHEVKPVIKGVRHTCVSWVW
jgi:hypothetical protein